MSDLVMSEKVDLQHLQEYEQLKPVNNNILCLLKDKASEQILKSGIIAPMASVSNTKPYLMVYDVPESITANKMIDIKKDDIVELGGGELKFFYGKNNERFVLVPATMISGIFRKTAT